MYNFTRVHSIFNGKKLTLRYVTCYVNKVWPMFLIIGKWIPVNKTEKQQKKQTKKNTPRTFDDIGGRADLWPQKRLPPFFIAFPLNENNVVNVVPSTMAPPMISCTKSSSSVVWRICGVLQGEAVGAALTAPVENMSEMGSSEFTARAQPCSHLCSYQSRPRALLRM